MAKIYLANAFSLNMIHHYNECTLRVKRINIEQAKETLLSNEFITAVGHQATAEFLSQLLDTEIPVNRIQITLQSEDKLIVVQLLIRLEEGKILSKEELQQLVENGQVAFYLVELLQTA